MQYKDQYLKQATKSNTINWINSNLSNYLKKNPESVSEVEHILDYLESEDAPPRISRMSYQEAKANAEKWIEKLNKKSQELIETEQDTELFLKCDDGFRFVTLKSETSYKREGALMSHCVASYYGNNEVQVISLRDPQNNPHCTIELNKDDDGEVSQIKGKGNGSIHPKYIKYVLGFLKEVGQEVRASELENLGYIALSSSTWELLSEKYSDYKYLTFGECKYLYKYSDFK